MGKKKNVDSPFIQALKYIPSTSTNQTDAIFMMSERKRENLQFQTDNIENVKKERKRGKGIQKINERK